jgi:maltodextrin utilization protein YvdJ
MRLMLLSVLLVAVPDVVLACPVCFGQNDSPLAVAMNNGILFMLGVVVLMLSGFAAFIVYLNRRARLFAADDPEPADAGGPVVSRSNPQEGTAQC